MSMSKFFIRKGFLFLIGTFSLITILTGLRIYFSPKPSLLEEVPFGSLILDKDGKPLRAGLSSDEKYRIYIPLEYVPPFAVHCLLSYEDKYFYSHPGFNPLAFLRSIIRAPFIGRLGGASTITMQLARMRFKLKTSDPIGKLRQIYYALILERHYNKEELLEAYFNLAPYGGNIEGLEAAAQIYFHKAASKLTAGECASLTVIPQNPIKRSPLNGRDFNRARQRLAYILGMESFPALKVFSLEDLPFLAPHLAMELEKSRGAVKKIIRTGIERDLQIAVEKILQDYVQRGKRYEINNAAALVVDSKTLKVSALAGSANFFDKNINGQVDGSKARRSPGSTLKPFIYALAMDQGLIHPMSILPDSPKSFALYNPENFDHTFRGPVPAREALKASRNLPAIWLSEKLRYPDLFDFLISANVKLPKGREHYGLALTLGGAEVSMRELATLYAMLVNGGVWKNLRLADDDYEYAGKRLLSPESSWLTLDMLRDEFILPGSKSIPIYAKTGTSNGMRDAWTAGICGHYVVIVWVGNFDNSSNPHFVGARSAKPLLEEIASSIASKRKLEDCLAYKPEKILETSICINTGDLDIGQCEARIKSYYVPGLSPVRDSGILRPIFIDRNTGLRVCEYKEGLTDKIWWEFWPSDMRHIFAQAGIEKTEPPALTEQCEGSYQKFGEKSLVIKLPKKRVQYQRQLSDNNLQIPLMASADPDVKIIHWYANARYLGSSKPEETILWKPETGGEVELVAVDSEGRSQRQNLKINTVP